MNKKIGERGDYLLDLFFEHGDGEFFDGGGVFYETAQERLTIKENKENKSVHCYAPLDYLVYMRSQDILKTFDKTLSSWKLSKIDSRLFRPQLSVFFKIYSKKLT
ncbi:MAG: hypothetical protein CM15mP123_13180 [Gammaproteobacteria bacterium]|nr:MAG: hypothetical protein CM15mP123_13180 [Gammaproteobacteria bacterium]